MTMAIREYTQRPKRAAEADGLNDITSGIAFLAITVMWYANQRFTATLQGPDFQKTADFKWGLAFFVLSIPVMFAMILLSKWYAVALREKYVYPRLGYASPASAPAKRRKQILMALSIGSAFLTAVASRSLIESGRLSSVFNTGILVALLGVIGGVTYFYHFAKLGFVRHLILGIVALVAGLVLAMVKIDDQAAIRCYTIIFGMGLIFAGGVTFAQLMRQPLIIAPEDNAK